MNVMPVAPRWGLTTVGVALTQGVALGFRVSPRWGQDRMAGDIIFASYFLIKEPSP